ncbi:MAG: SH3 domain-containing protein [Blastocatellia bacterium]
MPLKFYHRILPLIMTAGLAVITGIAQSRKVTTNQDQTQLIIGDRVLLDARKDGFVVIKEVRNSPTGRHFAVIACGYECTDNVGFVFNAGGTGKRKFTGRWDSILQTKLEWSADGKRLFYYRINSTGADPPRTAPPEEWVEIDLRTFRKSPATSRELKPAASYGVFNVADTGSLNVRKAAGSSAAVVGTIPSGSMGVKVTGKSVKIGRERWTPIKFESLAGWVNQRYLYEVSESNQ